jgi:hypothetical protein
MTEEILDEIDAWLEDSPRISVEALQNRWGLKFLASDFRLAVFPKRDILALYADGRNT